jgi:glucose/arabinose dehydrogenase
VSRTLAGLAVATMLVGAACRSPAPPTGVASGTPPSSSSSTTGPPVDSPSPSLGGSTSPDLEAVRVRLSLVVRVDQPLALATRPGDPSIYVAEKTGRVVAVRGHAVTHTVLDLSGQVSGGGEQGLLGLAFAPGGNFLYVDYTDLHGNTHVTQYRFQDGRAVGGSARDILTVEQPFSNHNGGQIAFGPDGDLYIGLGDGGSEGDPQNRGQDLDTLLGKILRIHPEEGGSRPYLIPSDNPFVGRSGARPEIWAYGLRNPWRFTFDRETGDLWIGDVGQNAWEEVDFQRAGSTGGQNYGWRLREGDHEYTGARPPHNVDPIYEYSHDTGGCVVTGGFVYRGSAIANLQGAYVFADYCLGKVTALVQRGAKVTAHRALGPRTGLVSSFGEDERGELYVLSLDGPVYQLVPA